MLVSGKCECFIMQMVYVCILSASSGSSLCCVVHAFQFLNTGGGCQRKLYGRGILQSRSYDCRYV